jgi:hypothetical protein
MIMMVKAGKGWIKAPSSLSSYVMLYNSLCTCSKTLKYRKIHI